MSHAAGLNCTKLDEDKMTVKYVIYSVNAASPNFVLQWSF